jgi:hypothetical protein
MKKPHRHQEPSRAALPEIPEVNFKAVKVRRNPYAERIVAEGSVHVRLGRPRKGEESGPTIPRPSGSWTRFGSASKSARRHKE